MAEDFDFSEFSEIKVAFCVRCGHSVMVGETYCTICDAQWERVQEVWDAKVAA